MAYVGQNPKFTTQTYRPQSADPSNPTEGMIQYSDGTARAEGLWVYKNGGWYVVGNEAAGLINHILNPGFEVDASGWATYADAAASTPVDGTGGSPSSTLTRSTSSPLRDVASGLWSKSAANRQGEGFSYAFSCDNADQGKIQQISFDYTVTANFVDGDMRVFIYDVTNSVLIEPSQRDVLANSGQATYVGFFQASSNSTSYRLIIHTATTSALAYDLKIDNVLVGPINGIAPSKTVAFRMVKTSTQAIATTAFTKITFTSVSSADTGLDFSNGGADTTNSRFTAPETGIYSFTTCVDTSATDAGTGVLGAFYKNGSLYYRSDTAPGSVASNQLVITCLMNLTKGDYVEVYTATKGGDAAYNVIGNAGFDEKSYFEGYLVKSTDAQASSNSLVAFRAAQGSTSFTGATTLVFPTVQYDTTGSYNSSTGQYTIPETGTYMVNAMIRVGSITLSTSQAIFLFVYRNSTEIGSEGKYGTGAANSYRLSVTETFQANKGDVITIQGSSSVSATMNTGSTDNHFCVTKLNVPAIIAPTEFVGCAYTTDAGQSIANNSTTTVLFEDRIFDSHNAYNTSTGEYVVPVSGVYKLEQANTFASSTAWTIAESAITMIYINGVQQTEFEYALPATSASSIAVAPRDSQMIKSLNKGNIITFRVYQNTGGSLALRGAGTYNRMSVYKIS